MAQNKSLSDNLAKCTGENNNLKGRSDQLLIVSSNFQSCDEKNKRNEADLAALR